MNNKNLHKKLYQAAEWIKLIVLAPLLITRYLWVVEINNWENRWIIGLLCFPVPIIVGLPFRKPKDH